MNYFEQIEQMMVMAALDASNKEERLRAEVCRDMVAVAVRILNTNDFSQVDQDWLAERVMALVKGVAAVASVVCMSMKEGGLDVFLEGVRTEAKPLAKLLNEGRDRVKADFDFVVRH